MKKFLLLAICALSVCLTGCSDNDTPEQLPDPELTLAPDAPIVFPAEGGSVEITVTTNMESWNAVSDQKWCNVAVSAGKFTVSAVENETPEAMPAATVTVTATSGERSVSRELQVSQEAGKEKYTDLSREGTSNCYLITAAVGAPIYDGDNNEIKITNSSQSSTADNNLAFAIANPTVCLSNYAQFNTSRDWLQADMSNDALWGNPKGAERNETNDFLNKGAKSFYDPCPVGWRVPPADVFRNFTASGGYAWVIDDFDIADISGDGAKSLADYDYGWTFNLSDSASSYFPAAARFDGSYAMLMGSMSGLWGSYWGNAPYPGDMFQGGAYSVLSFQIKDTAGNEMITTSPAGGGARADAYSVRCIRE